MSSIQGDVWKSSCWNFCNTVVTLALGFMGNAVQSNSIAASFHTAFGIPRWIMGLVVAVIAIFVFMGGSETNCKSYGKMAIVPLLWQLYILSVH